MNRKNKAVLVVASCVLPLTLALTEKISSAQGRSEIVLGSSQSAFGNGTFDSLNGPTINNAGDVSFRAIGISGSSGGSLDNNGLYLFRQGNLMEVARAGSSANGNGQFLYVGDYSLQDSGQISFTSALTGTQGGSSDDSGLFSFDGNSLAELVREGDPAPNNGNIGLILDIDVNESGHVLFETDYMTNTIGQIERGLFVHDGSGLFEVAREGDLVPGNNGDFQYFYDHQINESGAVAFEARAQNTIGGFIDDDGMYLFDGNAIVEVARQGSAAGNIGFFGELNDILLNEQNQITFSSPNLTGTAAGTDDNAAIFLHQNGLTNVLVQEGQSANGNGTLRTFDIHDFNDIGQVLFDDSSIMGTGGGVDDNEGLFLVEGTGVVELAREGDVTPTGNGEYGAFNPSLLNNLGQTAFISNRMTNTQFGPLDDKGIFITDSIETIEIGRTGNMVDGHIVTDIQDHNLNDLGQVVILWDDGTGSTIVETWTPDLHWRNPGNGNWQDRNSWTLSSQPAFVHDVFLDSANNVTITGVSNASVRTLQVGGGSGLATLDLQGGTLSATNGVAIHSSGILIGDGIINSDHFENGFGGTVRVDPGDSLRLNTTVSNAGVIETIGGELIFEKGVANQAVTGQIISDSSTVRFDNGIINEATIKFRSGNSDVFGNVNNLSMGTLHVFGGATATFEGDILQEGLMLVDSNSAAIFNGDISGSGDFQGGGDFFALGELHPGNSPASVTVDGNLFLGASTDLFIELGGVGIGEFDQFVVSGNMGLDGDLFISLLGGHRIRHNEEYMIIDIGGNTGGEFMGLIEGDLIGIFNGIDLFITYGAGSGNDVAFFSAVPEPGAVSILAICFVTYCGLRRKRSRK